jgi:hypothetical protein
MQLPLFLLLGSTKRLKSKNVLFTVACSILLCLINVVCYGNRENTSWAVLRSRISTPSDAPSASVTPPQPPPPPRRQSTGAAAAPAPPPQRPMMPSLLDGIRSGRNSLRTRDDSSSESQASAPSAPPPPPVGQGRRHSMDPSLLLSELTTGITGLKHVEPGSSPKQSSPGNSVSSAMTVEDM